MKIMLVAEYVVFLSGLTDIYQMVWDHLPVDEVVGKVFSCTNIHRAIDLTGITADDFRI